ncbi:type II toxin-antitoxin system RelE/ParE family toxin [Anaerosporobacter sp.]|uniref:type II toxin-antitoxin system RelE/ParE family toxin n=1 Tax=Anaerosporobacter sp. TaxID=1872529 RepID=UPI00286F0F4D|nr:type II toxin-antitoxin system RelE/ParE family toxin [Anaerosporobacter sp.]
MVYELECCLFIKGKTGFKGNLRIHCIELLVPETATKQVQRIMKNIRTLEQMPMHHQLFEDEPWRSQGIRYFLVDNYLVFYLPNESENMVSVVRIMYGGRDIRRQLKETI